MKLKFSEKAIKFWRNLNLCYDIYLITSKIIRKNSWNFVAFSEYMKEQSREVSTEPDWIFKEATFYRSIFNQKFKILTPSVQVLRKLSMSRFGAPAMVYKSTWSLKVKQSRKEFFKATFPPKNKWMHSTLLLWNLRLTCFHSFFGGNWRHQKDISKLTDLNRDLTLQIYYVDRCQIFQVNYNVSR